MRRAACLLLALLTAFGGTAAAHRAAPARAQTGGAQVEGAEAQPDPLAARQWGLAQVRAPEAWPVADGSGQRIAILDSGVDLSHPDLAGKVVGGATFGGCADQPEGCGTGSWRDGETATSASGHGTHVAGVASAATGNGVGIAGVAPGARLLAVKVASGETATTAEIAAGIRWSVRNGADVINLSLGGDPGTQALRVVGAFADVQTAVRDAVAAGVVVIAAAGNELASVCADPAFLRGVLCVVAVDRAQRPAAYSNVAYNEAYDVVAGPGGAAVLGCADDVLSTVPVGTEGACGRAAGTPGYDTMAGTSMAAPHVAGVAALLTQQGRAPAEVVRVLKATARTPTTGARGTYDPAYGYGIVDAAAAVAVPTDAATVVERLAGGDRTATAAAVSRRDHVSADVVVVARGDEYADALAGAPLAAHLGGPLLLSDRSALSSATRDEVRRLGARRAVLLGGEGALSPQVARDLEGLGVTVRRIAGGSRFGTAAAIAGELPAGAEVLLTEGANADPRRGWPDALSASGLAAAHRRPILLVTRDRLPDETAALLTPRTDAVIVGGTSAVGTAVEAQVAERVRSVRRLAGSNRYATSAAVAAEAERRGAAATTTWVATGRAFADGLVAGAGAGTTGGLLLLVDGQDLDRSPETVEVVRARAGQVRSLRLTGGTAAISADSERRLRELAGG